MRLTPVTAVSVKMAVIMGPSPSLSVILSLHTVFVGNTHGVPITMKQQNIEEQFSTASLYPHPLHSHSTNFLPQLSELLSSALLSNPGSF